MMNHDSTENTPAKRPEEIAETPLDPALPGSADWQRAAEHYRDVASRLAAALETAQCRLADLETESAVYNAEIERLTGERDTDQQRLHALEVSLEETRARLDETADRYAGDISRLREEMAREVAASRTELETSRQSAAAREEDLVNRRDEIARKLEDEQTLVLQLRQQLDTSNAQVCNAESVLAETIAQTGRLQEELDTLRDELERERHLYESAATEREAELKHEIDQLRQDLAQTLVRHQAEFNGEVATLRATLASENAAHEAARADLEARSQASQAEAAGLRQTLEGQTQTINRLREQIRQAEEALTQVQQESTDQIARIQTEAAAALHTLEQTQTELQAVRQANTDAEQRTTALRTALEAATNEIAVQKEQAEQLRLQIQEGTAATARERQAANRVEERVQILENDLRTSHATLDRLRTEMEETRRNEAQARADLDQSREREKELANANAALEGERGEMRLQTEKLSAVLRQLSQEYAGHRENAFRTQQTLNTRIEELGLETQTAVARIAELGTLAGQWERECERLRKERTSPDELSRFKREAAKLETRIEELEKQRAETAQNHSAVVAGYLHELNQRSDLLHSREQELHKLTSEAETLRETFEETQSLLEQERQERGELQRQLDELRKASGPLRLSLEPSAKPTMPIVSATVASPTTATFKIAGAVTPEQQGSASCSESLARVLSGGPLTIIHLEENKDLREKIRNVFAGQPDTRYLNTLDGAAKAGELLLAVNLLNRAHDPIAAIANHVKAHPDRQNIFAYCAEGNFGFVFGNVTFFAPPLDPEACIAWATPPGASVQRLLAASNNIEMTSNLRTMLSRVRCSTSVGLDLRQVTDLLPMIRPQAVLVDLSLARAEGLRLIGRLRSDENSRDLPIGVLLPEQTKLAEFRQHAARAARESAIKPEHLAASLARQLGLGSAPPAEVRLKVAGGN